MDPTGGPVARRIPALDGLRGVAVLLVFVFHYGGGAQSHHPFLHALGLLAKTGWIGVPLFFVLSGFLITGILWDSFEDPRWARKFYARRVLRIFPLYFGSLILTLIGAAFAGTFAGAIRAIWVPALFLQNIPGLSERVQELPSPLLLHHFWTLAVEEQFYLLWPLLLSAVGTRRLAARLCVATFLASLAFRAGFCAFGLLSPDWTSLLLSRAGELAAGGWLAIAYGSPGWVRVQRAAPATLVVGAVGFLLFSWQGGSSDLVGPWQIVGNLCAVAIAFSALIAMALRPGLWQSALSANWLQELGKISYGIYVFHILLRPLYWQVTHRIVPVSSGGLYFGVRFLVAALATLLVSLVSYRFYEQPFLRLKPHFLPEGCDLSAGAAAGGQFALVHKRERY